LVGRGLKYFKARKMSINQGRAGSLLRTCEGPRGPGVNKVCPEAADVGPPLARKEPEREAIFKDGEIRKRRGPIEPCNSWTVQHEVGFGPTRVSQQTRDIGANVRDGRNARQYSVTEKGPPYREFWSYDRH